MEPFHSLALMEDEIEDKVNEYLYDMNEEEECRKMNAFYFDDNCHIFKNLRRICLKIDNYDDTKRSVDLIGGCYENDDMFLN